MAYIHQYQEQMHIAQNGSTKPSSTGTIGMANTVQAIDRVSNVMFSLVELTWKCQIWLVIWLTCALSYKVIGETRNWTIASKIFEMVHVTGATYRMKGQTGVDQILLEICSFLYVVFLKISASTKISKKFSSNSHTHWGLGTAL